MYAHTKQQDKVSETDLLTVNPPSPHYAHLLALSHIQKKHIKNK